VKVVDEKDFRWYERRRYWRKREQILQKKQRDYAKLRRYHTEYHWENREYILARKKLLNLCRPTKGWTERQKTTWGGLPCPEPPTAPHTRAEAERLYHRKLRELRIAFGRDPHTGRKIRTVGKMAKSMQFVVDTREKRPWDFTDAIHMALKTGDYSLVGYEDTVAIERKSYDDIYQCLTVRRYNFCRQLRRLGKLKRAYLLIECSASAFLLGHIQHKLTGDKALLRLVKYTNEYGVPFCFCDRKGKELAEKILYCWWEELNAKQS